MQFEQFAKAHGVLVDRVRPVSRIQRCPTAEHPRSKNGAWFWDGNRGWVSAWDNGGEIIWFNDPNAKPWTEADKRAWADKRRVQRSEEDRRHEQAAHRATEILRSCKVSEHGYLRLKGVGSVKTLVTPDDDLFVPMRSLQSNDLMGAQIIHWDDVERKWSKKMIPGMRAKGAVLRLGQKHAAETFLCEGYATGLSIEMALILTRLDASVLVCFSDSNLMHVAPMVSGRAYVFADNDESGAGERAAKASGLPYCMSDVVGEDANDLHAREGIYVVSAKLMKVRQ